MARALTEPLTGRLPSPPTHAQYVIQQANADAALLKAREKDAGANVIPRGRAPVCCRPCAKAKGLWVSR